MATAKLVYLSLGSNLGDREAHLTEAVDAIEQECVTIYAASSIYETEPQDVVSQPWFLNVTIQCSTPLFPLQLLSRLKHIERRLGRTRSGAVRRGPRIIDIDILLFGNAIMDTPSLTLPHPRMFGRRFVLEPLLEIDPNLRDPRTKQPIRSFLQGLAGQKVRKLGELPKRASY